MSFRAGSAGSPDKNLAQGAEHSKGLMLELVGLFGAFHQGIRSVSGERRETLGG